MNNLQEVAPSAETNVRISDRIWNVAVEIGKGIIGLVAYGGIDQAGLPNMIDINQTEPNDQTTPRI
jgi:hypothetical protein